MTKEEQQAKLKKEKLARRRWERRRKWNELRLSALSILVMAAIFLLIAIFLLVWPRSKESQLEKRTLATFPKFTLQSYFSGDFTADIATFYDDTVPFRDSFKNAGNRMKGVFGLRGSDDTITIINNDIVAQNLNGQAQPAEDTEVSAEPQPEVSAEVSAEPTEEPDQKDYTGEDAQEVDMNNGLMIVKQDDHFKCLPLFGGGSGNSYITALNQLQEAVGDDVTIYNMPAPLSSQFYLPANAPATSVDQSECFDNIAEQLDERIVSINLCPVMEKHTEEPIYLRTDHHWAPLGAYYAARTLIENAGLESTPLEDYEMGINEGYVGTMYAFTNDARLLNDPEDFVYYKPNCSYTAYFYDTSLNYLYEGDFFVPVDTANSYLMFMGGDAICVKVKTDNHNGRKLLLIKDSYGNAEVPFYFGSFEEVWVVDVRYFQRNLVNFIDAMGITDVAVSMCAYSVVGVNADNMATLLAQDPDSELVDEQVAEEAEAAAASGDEEGSSVEPEGDAPDADTAPAGT